MTKITIALILFLASFNQINAQYVYFDTVSTQYVDYDSTTPCDEGARQNCIYANNVAMGANDYYYDQSLTDMFAAVSDCVSADYDISHWTEIFNWLELISPWQSWGTADQCSQLAWDWADQIDTDYMERTLCAEERKDICFSNAGCDQESGYWSDFPDSYCD